MTLNVNTPSKNYKIHTETNFGGLNPVLADLGLLERQICVITDSNVERLYLAEIMAALGGKAFSLTFAAGEQSKNLSTIEYFYNKLSERKFDRSGVILALGGGVCGDMAGFTAATYMRGVRFAQIPTTLLAQVDSSVGGKTGVDLGAYKNMVGAFYQPEFVYINVVTLRTLPAEQFASGMAEAIKHGLIFNENYFDCMLCYKKEISSLQEYALTELARGSCEIKAGVVARDEKEGGLREILNFGHTFGHAVEGLCNYELPHGHCVAIGMTAAAEISAGISRENRAKIAETLAYYGLPTKVPAKFGLTEQAVISAMSADKKARGGEINLVLLERIGAAARVPNAGESMIKRAIGAIL